MCPEPNANRRLFAEFSRNRRVPFTQPSAPCHLGPLPWTSGECPVEAKRKGFVVEELVVQVLVEVAVAVIAILFGQLLKKIGLVPA